MKNSLNVILSGVLILVIFGLFYVKDQVKYLKKDLAEINRQISDSKEQIHILEAEWQYLSDPERIRSLSEKYLDLNPIKVSQYSEPLNFERVDIAVFQADNAEIISSISPTLKPIFISY